MMYFSILIVSLVIVAVYTLYLEYKLIKLRKDLTRIATTLYDLVIVLNPKTIITIPKSHHSQLTLSTSYSPNSQFEVISLYEESEK